MRSMTGFGSGTAAFDGGCFRVEVRAVNHRYLEIRSRLPDGHGECCAELDGIVRRHMRRGRIDIAVHLEGTADDAPVLDTRRARLAARALQSLRDEIDRDAPLPLGVLASVPDLFRAEPRVPSKADRDALAQALDSALLALVQMREREGRALEEAIFSHLDHAARLIAEIGEHAPAMAEAGRARQRERLKSAVAIVTEAVGRPSPPSDAGAFERLVSETSMVLERSDVSEELTRLAAHAREIRAVARASDSLGRRLDFLLQEMARESNTIGAKSTSIEVTKRVVELRDAIERMREQTQNVE